MSGDADRHHVKVILSLFDMLCMGSKAAVFLSILACTIKTCGIIFVSIPHPLDEGDSVLWDDIQVPIRHCRMVEFVNLHPY